MYNVLTISPIWNERIENNLLWSMKSIKLISFWIFANLLIEGHFFLLDFTSYSKSKSYVAQCLVFVAQCLVLLPSVLFWWSLIVMCTVRVFTPYLSWKVWKLCRPMSCCPMSCRPLPGNPKNSEIQGYKEKKRIKLRKRKQSKYYIWKGMQIISRKRTKSVS